MDYREAPPLNCLKTLKDLFIAYFGFPKPMSCVPGLVSCFIDRIISVEVSGSPSGLMGRPGAPF